MAAGLPIITSDVPACREVLGDAGILVPEGGIDEMAKSIEILLNSSEKRRQLGEKASKRAERFYDMKIAIHNYYLLK